MVCLPGSLVTPVGQAPLHHDSLLAAPVLKRAFPTRVLDPSHSLTLRTWAKVSFHLALVPKTQFTPTLSPVAAKRGMLYWGVLDPTQFSASGEQAAPQSA